MQFGHELEATYKIRYQLISKLKKQEIRKKSEYLCSRKTMKFTYIDHHVKVNPSSVIITQTNYQQ